MGILMIVESARGKAGNDGGCLKMGDSYRGNSC